MGGEEGLGEGEGYGCVDPSEVSNTHTQLLLSVAHSTRNTHSPDSCKQPFPLVYVCVFGPVCESVILCL